MEQQQQSNKTLTCHFTSLLFFIFIFFHSSSLIQCTSTNTFDESLDVILHDHAFRVMIHRRPHTGALYNATPPPSLAGIKLSVLGLRTRTLYKNGANFSNFVIPPKTIPVPYVKRLAIVYHNLGNWSDLYYSLPGYELVSPVLGFVAYDASQLRNDSNRLLKIDLNTTGNPMTIEFGELAVTGGRMKCAEFEDGDGVGEVILSEIRASNVCVSRNAGHFMIVAPTEKKKKKKKMTDRTMVFWIVGCFVGVIVLVGLCGLVTAVLRLFLGKKCVEMEKEADDGEESLGSNWIGGSKMPRAEVTRTQPVIESATVLPNPKLSWYA